MDKPRLSVSQLINMSVGFLGIQFGWNLQLSNMSAIYEYLGANADQIPLLYLAAPLTGLIVQPIIGHMSDRTWNRLGRRRPYFLTGAILASLGLVLMPNSPTLWMAAGLLWILDASINISMEPFRAFVADMLPEEQRTQGFVMQSLMIGLGATIASALPYLMAWLGVSQASTAASAIPETVRISFYLGAAAFLIAVLWTVFTTKEYPPENMAEFEQEKRRSGGIGANLSEMMAAIGEMPATMKQLGLVQLFTWLGLFCMWLYFGVAIARSVFGAETSQSPTYTEGIAWGGICFSFYSVVCFVFSFFLPGLARRFSRKTVHMCCLLCGGAGLLSVGLIQEKWLLLLPMLGVGIAWTSILSMPYAILSGALPPGRTGVYMGVFNFFIVLPEITASLVFGWVMNHLLNNNRLLAVMAGGVFLIVAALLTQRVEDVTEPRRRRLPEMDPAVATDPAR